MKLERPKWPENKKCSAMITINLNAELFWLQLDPTCKDMPKTLSLGQYGMTRGVDRILEVLEERGIRATYGTVIRRRAGKRHQKRNPGHRKSMWRYTEGIPFPGRRADTGYFTDRKEKRAGVFQQSLR